jgi:hypothetical protein
MKIEEKARRAYEAYVKATFTLQDLQIPSYQPNWNALYDYERKAWVKAVEASKRR